MVLTKSELKHRLSKPLPGLTAHLKMAPANRALDHISNKDNTLNAMKSAVLILFFHDEDVLKMIVIRRSQYVGIHSGQIAFPGGRYEEKDKDIRTTPVLNLIEVNFAQLFVNQYFII